MDIAKFITDEFYGRNFLVSIIFTPQLFFLIFK